MPKLLVRLMREDAAQDLAEYGIALAVIGLIAGAAAITSEDGSGKRPEGA